MALDNCYEEYQGFELHWFLQRYKNFRKGNYEYE
jgi:hypothetical protein